MFQKDTSAEGKQVILVRADEFCVLLGEHGHPLPLFLTIAFFFFSSLACTFSSEYVYLCIYIFFSFFLSVEWAPLLNPSQPFCGITAEDPASFHGWHVESTLSAYQFSVLLVRWSVLGCCLVDASCFLTIVYLVCLLWFPGGHAWRCLKKISSSSPDMIIWVVCCCCCHCCCFCLFHRILLKC